MAWESVAQRVSEALASLQATFTGIYVREDTKVALGVGVALAAVLVAVLSLQQKLVAQKREAPEKTATREAQEEDATRENNERAEKILDHLRRGPHVRSARPEDNVHLPKVVKDVVQEADWQTFDEDAIVRKSKKAASRLGIGEQELREAVRKAKEQMDRAAAGEAPAEEPAGSRFTLFYILDKLILVVIVVGGLYLANKEQDGAVFRSLLRFFPTEARVLGFDVDAALGVPIPPETADAMAEADAS